MVANGGKQLERTNYVRINQNKKGSYKPASRGAAFQNKLMSNKRNAMKFRNRMQQKIMAERAQHSVGAYGGLGSHGLDFGESGPQGAQNRKKEIEGSFSGSAMRYAPNFVDSEEDECLLYEDDGELEKELKQIDNEVRSQESERDDSAAHEIPDTDEGYVDVLKQKFGHSSFREGQLTAVKLILEQKRNALVVLATGAGKSLCYQYVT